MLQRRKKAAVGLSTALLLLAPATAILAHRSELGPVIVDTDMAIDDARAIALLSRAQGIHLLAVLTSDGGSSPCAGASRVWRLLAVLDREGVQVGVGPPLEAAAPQWREAAGVLDALIAERAPDCDALPRAVALAHSAIEGCTTFVTWISLGPLTNLAAFLEHHPESVGRLRAVYYFGDLPDVARPGWNTLRDPRAAAAVIAAGIPLYLVRPLDLRAERLFDEDFSTDVAAFDSPAARWIFSLHAEPRVQHLIKKGHAGPWDDAVALAILEPGAFEASAIKDHPTVHRLAPRSSEAMRHALFRVLAEDEGLAARPSVILNSFPSAPSELRGDVAEIAVEILARHGAEEWKAALLTSELHRHLGIYSLVGVKMGIRARELLEASLDDLRVVSRAGLAPPMSCLTDGLQVATGASLGRGTISVEEGESSPEALFITGDEQLRLALREDVWNRIESRVSAAAERFGPLTPQYYDEIRRLSLRYWLELDRREIFNEKPTVTESEGVR